MSMLAAKRRRIDAAHEVLSKPFRSPFKSPLKGASAPDPKGVSLESTATKPLISKRPGLSRSPTSLTASSSAPRAQKTFYSPVRAAEALLADPEMAPLLSAQRELEKQLRELKFELDMAEQAGKIELESRKRNDEVEVDAELVELIGKWTSASRLAAEELFSKVRDRVNMMGGPRAWKEMEKKRLANLQSWDQEEPKNEDSDDERGDGKRDIYAEYSIDPETEIERSQRVGVDDTGELPGEEDDFTMAMMLRTMNVDLGTIGYDRYQQRWTD